MAGKRIRGLDTSTIALDTDYVAIDNSTLTDAKKITKANFLSEDRTDIALRELASNKTTVLSVSNDVLYPTVKAVNDGLDLKLDKDFTGLTDEPTLLGTDIVPINIADSTLKKTLLSTIATWIGETFTYALTTTAQTIKGAIDELVTSVGTKITKATNITSLNDTGIADGEIAVFNLTNKDIRTSDKTIVTTLGTDDTTVPTSKAVKDVTDIGTNWNTRQDDLIEAMLCDAIRQSAMISRTGTGVKNGITLPNPISYKDSGARYEMLGQTLADLLVNGDFSNGTTGWTFTGVQTLSGKICRVTGNGTGTQIRQKASTTLPAITAHKYYFSSLVNIPETPTDTFTLRMAGTTGGSYVSFIPALVLGAFTKYSCVLTATAGYAGNIYLEILGSYALAAQSDGKYFDNTNTIGIDLTAHYGSGNEPTAAQMDLIAPTWFDGTVNVVNPALRTEGKNRFNRATVTADKRVNYSTGAIEDAIGYNASAPIRVLPSTSYYGTNLYTSTPSGLAFYDVNGVFISGSLTVTTITTPTNAYTMRVTIANANLFTAQLELGTFATTYEAYKTNVLSLTETLRSVVDTVAVSNMSVYTASTWAEWTLDAGIVGGATGLEFTADGTNNITAALPGLYVANTKYLILFNVVSETLTTNSIYLPAASAFPLTTVPIAVGNVKAIVTSNSTISTNSFKVYVPLAETAGNKIKIKDLRIITLVAGSQLETDATNLTADQLAANIPYMATTGTATLSTVLRDRLYRQYSKWYIDRYVNPADGLKQTMATENAVVSGIPYIYRDGTSIIETSVIAPLVDSKIPYADVYNTYVPTLTWTTATPTITSSYFRYCFKAGRCHIKAYIIMSDGKGATNLTVPLPAPVRVGSGNTVCCTNLKINATWSSPVVQVIESTNLITFKAAFALTNGQVAEMEFVSEYEVA